MGELMEMMWLLPVVIGGVTVLIIFAAFRPMMKAKARSKALLQTGMAAPAKVLQVQPTGATVTVGGHRQPEVMIIVEVHPTGGAPFQSQIRTLVSEFQIPQLQPGAPVQVRYNPAMPNEAALEAFGGAVPGAEPGSEVPVVPMQAPMQSKAGAGVWIGIIGALIGVGFAVYMTMFATDVAKQATKNVPVPAAGSVSSLCTQAVECCKKVQTELGNKDALKACDNLKNPGVPESACQASFDSMKKIGETRGITCE